MALWNQRNLKAPVVLNAACKSQHIKNQISSLAKTSTNMLTYYSSLNEFEKAAAYQTRFVNRWRDRLRNMHGFQIMRRLNQTLIRIKNMDLTQVIMDFHSFLPDTGYIEREVNLPVRSNLEYMLVRMQGLCKLLMRVVFLTKEAARYHLKQIAINFLYQTFSMFLGLMGELWLFARSVCRRTVQFYDELYPALDILPETKVKWLPNDYQLPESLAEWLGEEYERDILQTEEPTDSLELEGNSNIFSLLQHHAVDEEESLLARFKPASSRDEEEESKPTTFSSVPKALLLHTLRSDTGEVVSRKEGKKNASNFDAKQLDHIRSKFHVQQFIKQERQNRTDSPAKAHTKGISEKQFGDFNVRLMKEFNRLSSAEFVKFFKEQFLELVTG
uniref:Nucleolus and neural progenitor protein-like N-terminal domain-containing protein n=1 Tax=Anopheles epiroticus TaxID=199890 RepID=A0A182PE40_9DIPT